MDKKKLAAISGVLALISAEDSSGGFEARREPNYSSPWALYSRQQIMQYRDITQRRIIKRSR